MTGPRKKEHQELLKQARKDYDRMFASQGGVCAICGRPPKTRKLHVDHDHKTMKVRGLLCYRCNRTIVTWITPEWCRKAAEYLEKSQSTD